MEKETLFEINEGPVRKGGINRHPPSSPRPAPPVGQGSMPPLNLIITMENESLKEKGRK